MKTYLSLVFLGFASQTGAIQAEKATSEHTGSSQSVSQAATNTLLKQITHQLEKQLSEKDQTIPEKITVVVQEEPQTVNLLPGVFHLQKGYNQFKGVPFFEGGQSVKDVFKFTFDQKQATSGDTSYLVPDQMDIPPLAYQCVFSERASEVTKGNSIDFMYETQRSVAYEGSTSIEYDKIIYSASVEASFSNSNSSARSASITASIAGMDKQMQTSAIATLYTFAVKEGEEETYLSEDFKRDLLTVKDWESAHEFVRSYGTHYMKMAKMGARFQENIYFSEKATSKEISVMKSAVNANSFSATVEGSYGALSGNVSGERDSYSSKKYGLGYSKSNSSSIQTGGKRQFGQISASGECGELLGDDNILFPVEYDSEPIYSIIKSKEYATAKEQLETYINLGLRGRGKECAKHQCYDKGVCVSDPTFFMKPLRDNMPYMDPFKKDECICEQSVKKEDCGKNDQQKQLLTWEQKRVKKLVWTTLPLSYRKIKVFEFPNEQKNGKLLSFINRRSIYLIFNSAYTLDKYRQATSTFGKKIIAVYRNHAIDSGAVLKPLKFIEELKDGHYYMSAVCPEGFKSVSHSVFPEDIHKFSLEDWRDNSVHCLKKEYFMTTSSQRSWYGYTGYEQGHVKIKDTSYYPNFVKTFKIDGNQSKFDLGSTGSVFLPTTIRRNEKVSPEMVRYAHHDFVFTEEPYQRLSTVKI